MPESTDINPRSHTTVMVFEPLSGGHRENFIAWLLAGVREHRRPGVDFVFVIPEKFAARDTEGVRCDPISADLSAGIASASWLRKRYRLWRLFQSRLRKHEPDHVLLMDLTQLEWALSLADCGCPLSAIDFVQIPEIPGPWKRRFKYLKIWKLLRRNRFENLFLLNGSRSARILDQRFGDRCRFQALPDPVWPVAEPARPREPAGNGPKRLLYFGSISNRKGFDVLAEALGRLPPEDARACELVVRGQPQHPKRYRETVRTLESLDNGLRLDIREGHLSEEEMRECFQSADLVLLPYRRPEYSSGVLAIAAREKRPVLGPECGLLGRLIRTYRLGVTVPINARSLSAALSGIIRGNPPFDERRAETFTFRNRPEAFARTLLDAVLETLRPAHPPASAAGAAGGTP